ncbi:acetoacetate decarboxylase [Staphylococcus simulans]|uniref:acetoacetate decarboxylase n=1 Tax=Staphylococcus simulans TaxID=1286 RepID=UPI000D1DB39C|nr:acetoacetate decarboxylase [Staphylococcus simulans]PTI91772.1 acetoacetate decarboxylase [Staphylococcus simulans]PTJ95183.1 acetoacetate decarboxylase [Staphylococcus simulans]
MNKKELMNLASTPVNAPTYSRVDVHFKNREFLNIVYRTDIEKLKEVVPEPLKVTSDLIKFEVIDMPDSTGLGSYTECGQVIPVEYNGEEGEFYLSMYLNNQPAIALGRELSTFPKKYGEPRLYVDNDTLVGTLDYHSLRVVQATMTYKYHPIETEEAKQLITKPSFMLKQLPNYDGTPRILEMTRSQITDIQIKEAFRGDARLQLFEHVNAPLADFPVKEIVDAQHILADLRLGRPEVIHDYLKES